MVTQCQGQVKKVNFLSICECFCDLCVMRLVRFQLKGILVLQPYL